MLCTRNRYGCINNGGNNVFVNCGRNVEIIVNGKHATDGGLVVFENFAFNPLPSVTVTDNDAVKFINCFDKDGNPFVLN